jgi:predicted tellurium resistance membrane protein TerC
MPQDEGGGHDIDASTHLFGAVKTIVIADAVMSVDNVIGIAGAAKDHLGLVIFGLLFSIPIIIWGSRFVLTLMDRFPLVIVFGAALLGWIGGGMIVDDVVLKGWATPFGTPLHYGAAAAGALFVVAVGKLLGRHAPAPTTHSTPVDLAPPKKPSDPS